jgi:hypothetical protein
MDTVVCAMDATEDSATVVSDFETAGVMSNWISKFPVCTGKDTLFQVFIGDVTQGSVVPITVANTAGIGATLAPVPASNFTCGLPGALSARLICAANNPVAFGVNVTVMVQVESGARERLLVQVVPVMANCGAFVPLIVTAFAAARIRFPVPLLVTVIVCDALVVFGTWLPNVSVPVGVNVTAAFPPLVPDSERVIGDVPPPVKLRVAVADSFVPGAAVGENVYVTVQEAPLRSVLPENPPQVFADCVKFPAFVPLSGRLVIVIVLPVVFKIVAICPLLVVPCGTVP